MGHIIPKNIFKSVLIKLQLRAKIATVSSLPVSGVKKLYIKKCTLSSRSLKYAIPHWFDIKY